MHAQRNAVRPTTPILGAALTALLLAAAPVQAAPGGGGNWEPERPPAGTERSSAADLDPDTVDEFVVAFKAVADIREEYSERIQQSGDRENAQALQREAQVEMIEAVEETELDVDTYNSISRIMSQDPQFAQQVMQRAGVE